jgi:uncharacterized protein YgbK (DUF1537 family)
MTNVLLGCIADDFTGATDLANNLVRAGMRVVQVIGVPARPLDTDTDALVVTLKSRTAPRNEAVVQSLDALKWLQAQGAQQIYFKYCSTFDSTPQGNIGPVAEALMDALAGLESADFTIATPAFPDNQRTVFKGHLFVGDSNLVRVLQAQCHRKVGLIDYKVVAQGETAIRARIGELRTQGVSLAIVDAISNDDLLRLGPALKGMPLVTAGSGVAIGLPSNFGITPSNAAATLPGAAGLQAALSGSCSPATNRQVQAFIQAGGPAFRIDPLQIAAGVDVTTQVLAWAAPLLSQRPVLIYSTADPDAVKTVQGKLGVHQAGTLLENALAAVAHGLVEVGVRQLVVAGGETAGACVQALNITQMKIGPQIDPGVPWCYARARTDAVPEVDLHLALKSGNFGADDFFSKAFSMLA